MNIFNFPAFNVLSLEENEHGYLITAETSSPPSVYPNCHTNSGIVGFGKKNQLFIGTPIHGKRTGILVIRP